MPRASKSRLWNAGAALLTLSLTSAAWAGEAVVESGCAGATPEGRPCPVLREAEDLLGDARETSAVAMRWLRENVSPGAVSALAQGASLAAECRWEAVLASVRAEVEREFGTSFYTPGSGTLGCGDWTPAADMPAGVERARVVLLVHGLDEPGDIWSDLAPTLTEAGLTVARFNYPNDQDPAISGEALGDALRALRADLGVERVDLVCHSMGGLISRDVLTSGAYYAGDGRGHDGLPSVGRLITIGTPNHGSALAPLRSLNEIREHVVRWMGSDVSNTAAALGFLADGDGAAADALDPGSDYLAALNARGLPAHVEVTVIIGRASPVTAEDVDEALSGSWVQRVLGASRTERLTAQAGTLVSTLGDAIVTVDSARLDGVRDTVVLEGNHRSLVRRMPLLDSVCSLWGTHTPTPPAIPVIVSRLTER